MEKSFIKDRDAVCIIPCAGTGSRMGFPTCGKEMLIDPMTMQPLIYWSLSLCRQYGIRPVVITTKGKVELQEYIKAFFPETTIVITEPTSEWPESVLKTKELWGQTNVLVLPDTRFTAENVIAQMISRLDMGLKIGAALHKVPVEETSLFGMVKYKGCGEAIFVEKPKEIKECNTAWGLLSFVPDAGVNLFQGFLTRNNFFELEDVFVLYLDSFKDITRKGYIETHL